MSKCKLKLGMKQFTIGKITKRKVMSHFILQITNDTSWGCSWAYG